MNQASLSLNRCTRVPAPLDGSNILERQGLRQTGSCSSRKAWTHSTKRKPANGPPDNTWQEVVRGKGDKQGMLKWQEFWRIMVLRKRPGDLDGVRSQGFRPPWVQRCQGNCAMILTLHCLNLLPLFLHLPLALSLTSVSLTGAREVLESALMMSAPQSRCLSAESQQPAFKVSAWPGRLERRPEEREGEGQSEHRMVEQAKQLRWPKTWGGSERSWSFHSATVNKTPKL